MKHYKLSFKRGSSQTIFTYTPGNGEASSMWEVAEAFGYKEPKWWQFWRKDEVFYTEEETALQAKMQEDSFNDYMYFKES